MNKSLLYRLVIAASISITAVSCAPSTPTVSPPASPAASAKPAAPASPAASPTASAKPTTAASPAASPTKPTAPAASSAPDAKVPDVVRVSVVNNSGKVLNAIYMSPPNNISWGQNELAEPIPDREKADFEWKRSDYKGSDGGCLFEVRAEYADGKSSDLEEIDLCKTPTINLK